VLLQVVRGGHYGAKLDLSHRGADRCGTEMIVRRVVTRMPEFSGGRMIYRYGIEGNVLSLEVMDEYSRDGARAPWILRQRLALKLQRVE
jgi:hypothetical protein